tara:strand:- start:491 stop:709 length:219 start_codon:yes stop_codon:yes gene_type:complete
MELFILGGYGQFVWPAFIFTFISCFSLYLKTKKEMQKQEKIFFSNYSKTNIASIKFDKKEKAVKKILSSSSI